MSEFRKIIENELTKHGYLLEEDAYDDRDNLILASKAYRELLGQYHETIKKYNTDKFDFELLLNGINYFKIETEYGPLEITFDYAPNEPYDGTFFVNSKNKPQIIINLAMFSDFEDRIFEQTDDNTYIKFKDWIYFLRNDYTKSTFIHEFQHYLDWSRGRWYKRKEKEDKLFDNEYYNSPIEKNAHTMQRIFEISKKIIDATHGEIMEYWTPEQRLDFLKNKWKQDEDFMKYYNKLEPQAQKKLLSRLYKYFNADFWNEKYFPVI